MVSKRLRFKLHWTGGFKAVREIEERFRPNNQTLLNRTEWRGKEPRSCAVTSIKVRPHSAHESSQVVVDIEVTYRPKGHISYLGTTKYDGWTVMVLNRSRDGHLLDRKGQPLKNGDKPVEIPNEVFRDIEFNAFDFGEFLEEVEIDDIQVTTLDKVIDEVTANREWNSLGGSVFVASHRVSPHKRIVLSNAPTDQTVDGFGTHILNINTMTPHLEHVLMEQILKLMSEFIEGKASIRNYGTEQLTFIEFDDSLVHCEPNEHQFAAWIDTLHWHTPIGFLEDLAKRLMAVFSVVVSVVDGKNPGLLLRVERRKD